MDKLSVRVLKYLAKENRKINKNEIISVFGESAQESLSYLEKNDYISSEKVPAGIGPDKKVVFLSNGVYSITSFGKGFLEAKPGRDFDKWLTRLVAIWGAITGTAALVLEVVLHFL